MHGVICHGLMEIFAKVTVLIVLLCMLRTLRFKREVVDLTLQHQGLNGDAMTGDALKVLETLTAN